MRLAARIQVFDTLAGPASGATSAPSKVSGTPSLGFGGDCSHKSGQQQMVLSSPPQHLHESPELWEGNPFTEQHSALLW